MMRQIHRDGSPDNSKKKSTPAAPKKDEMKSYKTKTGGKAKKKNLANEYVEDEKPVYVKYTLEGIVIRGEQG